MSCSQAGSWLFSMARGGLASPQAGGWWFWSLRSWLRTTAERLEPSPRRNSPLNTTSIRLEDRGGTHQPVRGSVRSLLPPKDPSSNGPISSGRGDGCASVRFSAWDPDAFSLAAGVCFRVALSHAAQSLWAGMGILTPRASDGARSRSRRWTPATWPASRRSARIARPSPRVPRIGRAIYGVHHQK